MAATKDLNAESPEIAESFFCTMDPWGFREL
jgi:hypothetical protein